MKKVVLKAVFITLACVIATASITYLVLNMAFPATLARLYGNVGVYDKAVHYEVNAYKKSGKFDDIVAASDYALMSGDTRLIYETVALFVEDDARSAYSDAEPARYDYIVSKYVVAKYALNGGDGVGEEAFSLLHGYSAHNPVESLIVAVYEAGDAETMKDIYARLVAYDESVLSESEKVVLADDKAVAESLING